MISLSLDIIAPALLVLLYSAFSTLNARLFSASTVLVT